MKNKHNKDPLQPIAYYTGLFMGGIAFAMGLFTNDTTMMIASFILLWFAKWTE